MLLSYLAPSLPTLLLSSEFQLPHLHQGKKDLPVPSPSQGFEQIIALQRQWGLYRIMESGRPQKPPSLVQAESPHEALGHFLLG